MRASCRWRGGSPTGVVCYHRWMERLLPTHTPLARPSTQTDALTTFLTTRYQPELAAIIEEYRRLQTTSMHRGDLFRLGQRAAVFKMELSAWLGEATRLHQTAYTDYLRQVQEGDDEGRRQLAETIKNEARKHVSAYQKVVDQLKYAREDMRDALLFSREAIRALTEEDYLERDTQ